MARTREFDGDEALQAASRVFWEKGYEATSVQDLVDATGVNRASLYQTFGNKRALFQKALDRFACDQNVQQTAAGAPAGMARIRAALRLAGEQAAADVRGCMIVNAIVERAAQDEKMQAVGRSTRLHLEQFFARELAEAERHGEIPPGRDRRALARFLANALFGLRVTAKTCATAREVRSIVEATLVAVQKD
ncbi:MAG TPA: helix-turn-helix domain-containing protein [Bryobacteraceae bacterium]|nr:helix-turn-helix domain-containing protein [Bryobacteraceae bacterium]